VYTFSYFLYIIILSTFIVFSGGDNESLYKNSKRYKKINYRK